MLVSLGTGDTEATCAWAATLRIFEDGDRKMNLGLQDLGGEILTISQFALAGSIAN